jgi:hypothetical protein
MLGLSNLISSESRVLVLKLFGIQTFASVCFDSVLAPGLCRCRVDFGIDDEIMVVGLVKSSKKGVTKLLAKSPRTV